MPAHIRRFVMLPLALLVLALFAGCASQASTTPLKSASKAADSSVPALPALTYIAAVHSNIAYGPLSGESLDLCTPHGAKTARPGVLLIHGGGWSSGDKSLYDDLCKLLAQYGFLAATMNYRLAPDATWPAQLVDAQLAVRWLRASAHQLNLDPTRLCAYGDSAGAQLALFLGSDPAIHAGDEAALHADESPKATCVVDASGPVDLTLDGANDLQQSILRTLFGGATLASDPALYRDASPLFDVTAASAPTLIIQGSTDTLVPPSQSQALQAALQSNGVPVHYLSYPGDHSFTGLSQQQIDDIVLQAGLFLTAHEHP